MKKIKLKHRVILFLNWISDALADRGRKNQEGFIKKLAKKAHISESNLRRFIDGDSNFTMETIAKIADCLDCAYVIYPIPASGNTNRILKNYNSDDSRYWIVPKESCFSVLYALLKEANKDAKKGTDKRASIKAKEASADTKGSEHIVTPEEYDVVACEVCAFMAQARNMTGIRSYVFRAMKLFCKALTYKLS